MNHHIAICCFFVLAWTISILQCSPSMADVADSRVEGLEFDDDIDRKPKKLLEAALKAEGPGDVMEAFVNLFVRGPRPEIIELKSHDHDTIALRAAWELVERTIPEEPGYDADELLTKKINRRALHQFAGFVEGRLKTDLPEWWKTTLLKASAYGRGNIDLQRQKRKPYLKTDAGVYAPLGIGITRPEEGGIEFYSFETDESCRVPAQLWRKTTDKMLAPAVTAVFHEKRCYVGIHGAISGSFQLRCLECETSKVVWSAQVWASLAGGGFSGPPANLHFVTLKPRGDRILVFGKEPGGMYVEGFSLKDGKNQFRFGTPY